VGSELHHPKTLLVLAPSVIEHQSTELIGACAGAVPVRCWRQPEMPMAKQLTQGANLYDRDFYSWTLSQAELVRARRLGELDLENIAEELRSSGSEQEHRLESSYRVLLMHLLKWAHQPRRRSRSWRATIVRERLNVERTLRRNSGLKALQSELYAEAYRAARKEAAAETGLSIARFPEVPPFTMNEAMDEHFWPAGEANGDVVPT
jgi:hypothetical protein